MFKSFDSRIFSCVYLTQILASSSGGHAWVTLHIKRWWPMSSYDYSPLSHNIVQCWLVFNTLRPAQNGRDSIDYVVMYIFLNEKYLYCNFREVCFCRRSILEWFDTVPDIGVVLKRRYAITVYPKKYAHVFCFAVLCCIYTLTDCPISIRLTSLALWQSKDCPSASKATLMNMDKYLMWIHYERLHNHNKAKHNKTVCIFLWIYCSWPDVDPDLGEPCDITK